VKGPGPKVGQGISCAASPYSKLERKVPGRSSGIDRYGKKRLSYVYRSPSLAIQIYSVRGFIRDDLQFVFASIRLTDILSLSSTCRGAASRSILLLNVFERTNSAPPPMCPLTLLRSGLTTQISR
jgi:hypothetical protein